MNKRLLWVILIVITLGVDALAIDFMGPPTASLKRGQSKIGYTYHQSESDILFNNIELNGVDAGLGEVEINGIKTTRNYFTYNYGVETDRMEIYGFLGVADIKEGELFGEDLEYSGGNDFACGGGIKITTNIYDNADWGILAQASWLRSEDSQSFDSGKIDSEFDAVEIQVAAGPTVKITKDFKVYGGIVGYWLKGEFEEKISGDLGSAKLCGDLEQDSAVGGYIGTQIDLFKNVVIAAEFASTGDSSGFGVNVAWKF
jgi:hypothetical protein